MIKTTDFGKHAQTRVVEFGTGDILMTRIKFEAEGTHAVLLGQDVPKKVGTETTEYNGKDSDQLPNVQVILAFKNPESINALIHSLVELQRDMFDVA